MSNKPQIPDIPEGDRTDAISQFYEVVRYQSELIQGLRNEIAVLKGHKPKPKIKPSGLVKKDKKDDKKNPDDGKRSGSKKRNKTMELEIHNTSRIAPDNIPEGSRLKDCREYVVQGIIIKPDNTLYILERWETPDGRVITGKLPLNVHGHFDSSLISYIQYQYFSVYRNSTPDIRRAAEIRNRYFIRSDKSHTDRRS